MQTTDFSRYRVQKDASMPPTATEEASIGAPLDNEFDLESYRAPKPAGPIKQAVQSAAEAGIGFASGILGGVGDAAQAVDALGEYLGTTIADYGRQLLGKEKLTDEQKDEMRSHTGPVMKMLKLFPTSDDVNKYFDQLNNGSLLPKSETTSELRRISTDIGSLFNPVFGPISLARAAGSVLFGEGAGELAKVFGASESAQNKVKGATTFLGTILNPGGARRYGNNLLRESYKKIDPTDVVATKPLLSEIRVFNRNISDGGLTPDKNLVYNISKQFERDLMANPTDFSPITLANFRNSVNELRFSKGLGSQQGGLFPKGLSPKTQGWLNELDNIFNSGLTRYGKNNPTFLNEYREGNLALSGIHKADRLQNTISKNVDMNKLDPKTLLILGMHAGPGTVGALTGLAAVGKTASLLRRIATNAPLRRYYTNVLRYGSQNNLPLLKKNLNFLDKELKKIPEDSDEPIPGD